MPVKRLPRGAHLDQLKRQGRDLLAAAAAGEARACQRLREFHPRFAQATDAAIAAANPGWSDALFAIAREYGFANWPRLKAHVDRGAGGEARGLFERIDDPVLRRAVQAMDEGDLAQLRELLARHPDLLDRRACFEGENYFRTPALLAFIADNPVRNDCLPQNAGEIAGWLLEHGAARHRGDVEETLGLVVSGRVARESGLQDELIGILVAHGAAPDGALPAALAHGAFKAARTLLRLGARMTLPAAAALGEVATASTLLAVADAHDRHLALALAAQHGRVEIVRRLLASDESPNRFNPPGAHSHSTPLHQAAWHGHEAVVAELLAHGADAGLRDVLWNATAAQWAEQAGRPEVARLIASLQGRDGSE